MTLAEINRAEAIRAMLLDERIDPNEIADVLAGNALLLARVIEYYCAAWVEVESFRQGLRIVTGEDVG